MKSGDIIEVLSFENGELQNMRRVRVTEVCTRQSTYHIKGTNMRGKNTVGYKLPKYPDARPDNGLSWVDSSLTEVGEV
jgi:hypothetical protein